MSEERQTFIIVMRDTAFWVVGPFPDGNAIQVWDDYEYNHGGDPRWQTVELFSHELDTLKPLDYVKPIDWHPPVMES